MYLFKVYDNGLCNIYNYYFLLKTEESIMCPFKSDCSMFCPPELYGNRHKTCARYMAANEIGIAAVPHEMSAINYALIQTLKR